MQEHGFILHCCPGDPLPDGLLEKAIKGTGLEPRKDISHVYGSWVWDYSDISSKTWKVIRPILGKNITSLYHQELIRGGEW